MPSDDWYAGEANRLRELLREACDLGAALAYEYGTSADDEAIGRIRREGGLTNPAGSERADA